MFEHRHLQRLLPFWLLLLGVGSFLPSQTKMSIGTQPQIEEGVRWQHRAYHILSFGLTALLVSLVNRASVGRTIFSIVAAFAFGLGIEISQSLVFKTPIEFEDIRDDGYGALAFAFMGHGRRLRQALVRNARS